jgi:hypothetical protein
VKHGQGPVLEEIAAECGLAVEAIIGIQRNFFADPLYAGHRRALSVASRTCSYREREVLKLLYGFGDGYTYTRDEVAHFFKESAEVIRQVERDGIGRILAYLEDKGWDRYAQW